MWTGLSDKLRPGPTPKGLKPTDELWLMASRLRLEFARWSGRLIAAELGDCARIAGLALWKAGGSPCRLAQSEFEVGNSELRQDRFHLIDRAASIFNQ